MRDVSAAWPSSRLVDEIVVHVQTEAARLHVLPVSVSVLPAVTRYGSLGTADTVHR